MGLGTDEKAEQMKVNWCFNAKEGRWSDGATSSEIVTNVDGRFVLIHKGSRVGDYPSLDSAKAAAFQCINITSPPYKWRSVQQWMMHAMGNRWAHTTLTEAFEAAREMK